MSSEMEGGRQRERSEEAPILPSRLASNMPRNVGSLSAEAGEGEESDALGLQKETQACAPLWF